MQLPQTTAWVPLRNSERPIPSGGKWLGPVDPNEALMIAIHLRPGIRAGRGSTSAADAGDLGNPSRHWRYEPGDGDGANPADLDRIRVFARDAGLDVIELSAARRSVVVWGTAAAIAGAFKVELAHYECAGRICRGQIGPVYLPPTVAHIVEDVSGLHDGPPDATAAAIPSRTFPRFKVGQAGVPLLAFLVGTVLGVLVLNAGTWDRRPGDRAKPTVQRAAPRPAGGAPRSAGSPAARAALHDLPLLESGLATWKPARAAASHRLPAPQGPPLRPADRRVRGNGQPPHLAVTDDKATPAQQPTASNGTLPQPATTVKAGLQTPTPPAKPADNSSVAAAPRRVPDPATPVASQPASPTAASSPPATPPGPARPQTSSGEPAAAAPGTPGAPAPAGQATSPSSGAVYMVRIGPVFDRDRATAVAKQLATAGFVQSQITMQPGYRVVSEPLPRKAAEDLMATLARRGIRSSIEPATGESVQLIFGIATSQADAETLSSRIAAAGYDAWIRESPVYILRLGPYPQVSVNAITGVVRAGAPEAIVVTDPASTP